MLNLKKSQLDFKLQIWSKTNLIAYFHFLGQYGHFLAKSDPFAQIWSVNDHFKPKN